jgi:hypothetical protein
MMADRELQQGDPAESQRQVFAFLKDPQTHGGCTVRRIDTHGAAVFLAGDDVYKVKRAVRYPYLDFSTLEKRRAACCAEIAVNHENAPDLYLGVLPIVRRNGALALGGEGDVVEWAVHLRRFDENATLDRLAETGPLGDTTMDALADAILRAHRHAPSGDHPGAVGQLASVIEETAAALAAAPGIIRPELARTLGFDLRRAFETVEDLLRRRVAQGAVRRCHGDLHLGNIVKIAEKPVLFDAIEFDDAIATCDVLYDLAFLLMDLWERGLRADANRLLNRYLAGTAPDELFAQLAGLEALPLFMALRAAIRAKVLIAQGAAGERVRAYAETAARFLAPSQSRLMAVGGLSGSGKTKLAAAVAAALGRAPGAVHLRSDLERKHLFGREEQERLGACAYRSDVSQRVQARLLHLAQTALRAGQSVILDATHRSSAERQAVEDLALNLGVPFHGLWLDAPGAVLMARVAAREGDASDATAAVVAAQLETDPGRIGWTRLDATQEWGRLRREAMRWEGEGP